MNCTCAIGWCDIHNPAIPKDMSELTEEVNQFPQPTWGVVQQAFLDGAREARQNPSATDHHFIRSADAYTKLKYHDYTGKYSE